METTQSTTALSATISNMVASDYSAGHLGARLARALVNGDVSEDAAVSAVLAVGPAGARLEDIVWACEGAMANLSNTHYATARAMVAAL